MECIDVLKYIGLEVADTIIALATTAIVGGLIWLVTLRSRSNTIRVLLSNPQRKFILYYRGSDDPEHNKKIVFNTDGSIGLGANANESRWAVRSGLLEIYSSSGAVYSKFKWDKGSGRLVHTNDPTLPSVMGQYIVPLFIPAASKTSE